MSDIFDARQEEITFDHLEREPMSSEDLSDIREIMKQYWDMVRVDECVVDDCFVISKYLGNRYIGWHNVFFGIEENDPFVMKNRHHGDVKGRCIL